MRIIEDTVDIQAPAATVWQMVTDTDRYADWNPFMPRLSGRLTPGERLTLTVRRAPGGTGALIAGTRVSALADTWLAPTTAGSPAPSAPTARPCAPRSHWKTTSTPR
jgi:uncharacterized protein YndB with AHSA1/START domain